MDISRVSINNYRMVGNLDDSTTISTEEREKKYIENLQKEYSGLKVKKNDCNVNSRSGITINLSSDLIKKAVKDKKIDKRIRKTLDDLYKNKQRFKAYNCSKEGHEVVAVSFFIDGREKTSCSIKLNQHTSTVFNTKEKRKLISSMIEKEKVILEKTKDFNSSLYYKYINLLSENRFKSIDFTV